MAESKDKKAEEKVEKKPSKKELKQAFINSKLKALNTMPDKATAEALAKRVLRINKED